jgi:hypothetical protein
MTFLLSGMPAKEEADELADLIETHGGKVQSEVPSPAAPAPFSPSPPAGAPMPCTPAAPGTYTRVITPKPGRTLKCLYAAAVGAPIITPQWIHASLEANRTFSVASAPPGLLLSGRPRQSRARAGAGGSRLGASIDDDVSPMTGGAGGGLFNGIVIALSGDEKYLPEFGLLLRHAGAELVSADGLGAVYDGSAEDGAGLCDYVVVQGGSKMPASVQRAAKRQGVPCVWHEWVVESLLSNSLRRLTTYLMGK